MLLHGVEIRRDKIPEYFTEDAIEAIDLWHRFKMLGLPFSGGWAEQPSIFIAAIEACEIGYRKIHGNS